MCWKTRVSEVPGSVCYERTHQFEFCLSRRRGFYRLNAFLARRRVEETQEGLVRLNAVVGPLFRNLEGELQFIIRTQGDSIGAFCKGNSVGIILSCQHEQKEYRRVTYASERSWSPSDPKTVKRSD